MKFIVAGGVAAACACAALVTAQVWAQSGGTSPNAVPDAGKARPKSVCPQEDMDDFHACALEKMKTFKPPLTSYGKPDMTGMWRAQVRGQDIEAVDEAKSHLYGGWPVMESIIVDPPDGNIWITDSGQGGTLVKFNPKDETFTNYPSPQGADKPSIEVTRDGAIWYSPRGVDRTTVKYPGLGVLYPNMDKIKTLAAFPGEKFGG